MTSAKQIQVFEFGENQKAVQTVSMTMLNQVKQQKNVRKNGPTEKKRQKKIGGEGEGEEDIFRFREIEHQQLPGNRKLPRFPLTSLSKTTTTILTRIPFSPLRYCG